MFLGSDTKSSISSVKEQAWDQPVRDCRRDRLGNIFILDWEFCLKEMLHFKHRYYTGSRNKCRQVLQHCMKALRVDYHSSLLSLKSMKNQFSEKSEKPIPV